MVGGEGVVTCVMCEGHCIGFSGFGNIDKENVAQAIRVGYKQYEGGY